MLMCSLYTRSSSDIPPTDALHATGWTASGWLAAQHARELSRWVGWASLLQQKAFYYLASSRTPLPNPGIKL